MFQKNNNYRCNMNARNLLLKNAEEGAKIHGKPDWCFYNFRSGSKN